MDMNFALESKHRVQDTMKRISEINQGHDGIRASHQYEHADQVGQRGQRGRHRAPVPGPDQPVDRAHPGTYRPGNFIFADELSQAIGREHDLMGGIRRARERLHTQAQIAVKRPHPVKQENMNSGDIELF
jgi:hypothetical protein